MEVAKGILLKAIAEVEHSPQVRSATALFMVTAWVIDSNCFIHMGQVGDQRLKPDLEGVIGGGHSKAYIAAGVHHEVGNVPIVKHPKRPKILKELESLLTTIPIPDNQVKGLAQRIGERAAPQDVDLSLMVLATRLAGQGEDVCLVSDDFKMTKTGQRVHLPYTTCPPSTFLLRLSKMAKTGESKKRLKSLSKRVRAEEMRYAISRRNEYDVQDKLTWLIDGIIDSGAGRVRTRAAPLKTGEETGGGISAQAKDLRRHLLGEKVKQSKVTQLNTLPEACAQLAVVEDVLEGLGKKVKDGEPSELLENLQKVYLDAQEDLAIRLAPLTGEEGSIAMAALTPTLCRLEISMAIVARSAGQSVEAERLLASAGLRAALIDDDEAEVEALYPLGLLALHAGDMSKASRVLRAAAVEAEKVPERQLEVTLAASLASQLDGDSHIASRLVEQVHDMVDGNEAEAIGPIERLGDALIAVGEPALAIEIYDEALECAVETEDGTSVQRLSESIARCDAAMGAEDVRIVERLRGLVDQINTMDDDTTAAFEERIGEIEERRKTLEEPLDAAYGEWTAVSVLTGGTNEIEVLSVDVKDGTSGPETLAVIYHPGIGNLGLWLPDTALETGDVGRYKISFVDGAKAKVAAAPDSLRHDSRIRALITIEDPKHAHLQHLI